MHDGCRAHVSALTVTRATGNVKTSRTKLIDQNIDKEKAAAGEDERGDLLIRGFWRQLKLSASESFGKNV